MVKNEAFIGSIDQGTTSTRFIIYDKMQNQLDLIKLNSLSFAHKQGQRCQVMSFVYLLGGMRFMRNRLFPKLVTSRTMCSKASTPCSSGETNESRAKVIYSLAPAMGHNEEGHPECSSRVPAIVSALEKVRLTPQFRGSEIVQLKNFRTATVEDIANVHSKSYVSALEKAMEWASVQGVIPIDGSGDTYATATTFKESLAAAGAGLSLVDSVVAASKITKNPPVGFALIRPPGHHAIPKGPMGFCFFGNVAIAARYAQQAHGLKRVFIIDFDVHHGNGTSDAFYDDPDIFFISTHQMNKDSKVIRFSPIRFDPYSNRPSCLLHHMDGSFPGTGKFDDLGHGNGEGATLNLPLPEGSGDLAMRTVFDQVIVPSAQRFKPDIILVSAGYDAHVLDPLANFQFGTGTYYMLAMSIKQLAKDLCGGRCVFFLEGGYNLKSLSNSVAESFRAFIGEPSVAVEHDERSFFYDEPSLKVKQAIERIKHLHSL